tara:strand:- start:28 stop:903 length:876 start_codon:yes stop_codon:yes gene_type:complete
MPISKIPVGAIQSGTIGTSQIADNAVTTAKILNDNVTSAKIPNSAVGSTEIASDAVTGDKIGTDTIKTVNADSIMLNSTNGTADAGDFLVLDGTDNSSTNANDRILYDETFNPATFNIGTGTAGQAIKVATNGGLEFGTAGGVLQTVSVFKSDTDSTTSTSDVAISGLSVSITPSSASNKILVMFAVGTAGNNASSHFFFTPYRDIGGGGYNAIGLGVGATYNYASAHYATSNNNYSAFGNNFLDSPNTTSEITYKLYFRTSAGHTSYINRRAADDAFRGASSLTVMEISG